MKPPIEYCPECLSLKRKPNKECVNHEKYRIDRVPHLIEITKEYVYIVRCVGDYADIVRGRNADYEFSEVFDTFKDATKFAKGKMKQVKSDYKKHGKKTYVKLIENI